MSNTTSLIFCEGDWTLINNKWIQIWTILNDTQFKCREGNVYSPNGENLLSNGEFFEQKVYFPWLLPS